MKDSITLSYLQSKARVIKTGKLLITVIQVLKKRKKKIMSVNKAMNLNMKMRILKRMKTQLLMMFQVKAAAFNQSHSR